MKILITNNTLGDRAGTEIYVRDVAVELLKRGHTPIAYSTVLGTVAGELRRATVPVIEHLDALATPPDLIHGHHHLETMTALLHFPGVPAIYFCHGWLPWEELPPKFPRILRYVAVDETCRDRLVHEHAIPEEHIRLILNFVDLTRFKPRNPLPEKPTRALIFSNNATETSNVPPVRQACMRANIELDVVGRGTGNATSHPEEILPNYDLVFAKGRAALEALSVGAAVILLDAAGVGPIVSPANMRALRRLNFGIRTLQNPIEPEIILERIERYNAADATHVSSWVRQTAAMGDALDQLVALYEETLEEHRKNPSPHHVIESRAASVYLRHWVPNLTLQQHARARHEVLRIEYESRVAECQRRRETLAEENEQLREQCRLQQHARAQHEALRIEYESRFAECQRRRETLAEENEQLREQCRLQQQLRETLQYQLDALQREHGNVEAERNSLRSELDRIYASLTLQLRNRLIALPGVGPMLRSCIKLVAGRG